MILASAPRDDLPRRREARGVSRRALLGRVDGPPRRPRPRDVRPRAAPAEARRRRDRRPCARRRLRARARVRLPPDERGAGADRVPGDPPRDHPRRRRHPAAAHGCVGRARATRMLLLGERLGAPAAEDARPRRRALPDPRGDARGRPRARDGARGAAGARRAADQARAERRRTTRASTAGLAIEREAAIEALAQPEAREGSPRSSSGGRRGSTSEALGTWDDAVAARARRRDGRLRRRDPPRQARRRRRRAGARGRSRPRPRHVHGLARGRGAARGGRAAVGHVQLGRARPARRAPRASRPPSPTGTVEDRELREWMLVGGLRAAAMGVPFLPTRAGLGSELVEARGLRTVPTRTRARSTSPSRRSSAGRRDRPRLAGRRGRQRPAALAARPPAGRRPPRWRGPPARRSSRSRRSCPREASRRTAASPSSSRSRWISWCRPQAVRGPRRSPPCAPRTGRGYIRTPRIPAVRSSTNPLQPVVHASTDHEVSR